MDERKTFSHRFRGFSLIFFSNPSKSVKSVVRLLGFPDKLRESHETKANHGRFAQSYGVFLFMVSPRLRAKRLRLGILAYLWLIAPPTQPADEENVVEELQNSGEESRHVCEGGGV